MKKLSPGDFVEHAPDLGLRVRTQIGRCRPAPGPAFEIEAEAITMNAPDPLLDRAHAAPHPERPVVHIGAIGKVPDVLARPPDQGQAMKPVIAPREAPGPSDEPAGPSS